jgi:FAD/FMN-containing dehydrogenase
MSLGGALAANAHGHGLGIPPIVSDVEWIDLLTADGTIQRCDRKKNRELFSLAIGGYGLFGIIVSVGLRLAPRRKLRRRVEKRTLPEALRLVEGRTKAGSLYGYFQYSISETSPEFLRSGILTTYEPAALSSQVVEAADVPEETLQGLLELAHSDREAAYRKYATLELDRDGAIEWSDLHQLSTYPAGYHQRIEKRRPEIAGADLILEVYVPRNQLISFAEDARNQLLETAIPLVYGTVRFTEKDKDSFLAWAQKSYARVIFTPHVGAGSVEMEKAQRLCRRLEQSAIRRGGSFYLTYNRFATRSELDSAYPQFSSFLALKSRYDPGELFQSEWYRFYKKPYA